jgi:DNA mismatch endonuclease (patch repair protein)
MGRVRQRDTKPELLLRRALHRLGFRYRVNHRQLPGSPDLVFPSRKAVVFVNGCFWHDHAGCRFATKPQARKDFWAEKFQANRERDQRNYAVLKAEGWRTLIVWECSLKGTKLDATIKRVAKWLDGTSRYLEVA